MFYGITDLTTFVLGTIFIVLLPGPNSLYVMTVASKAGIRPGYQAAAGVFVGDIILMVLSATGAASVLAASPALFIGLKYLGAGYLSWIGYGLIRAALRQWSASSASSQTLNPALPPASPRSGKASVNDTTSIPPRTVRFLTPFRTALGISLINPKSILFFVSFFIQFVDPGYAHPALSFFILGVVLQIISMIYLSALILGGAHLAQSFSRQKRLSSLLNGAVGLIFIGFGVRLATASLS
jgi:leucine efflux protein